MLSVEATGKNLEQAINNALFELKASREDVDIKILDEGGFFRKAKVVVSISEDAIEKYEKKEQLKKQEVLEEQPKVEAKAEPVTMDEVEKQPLADEDEEIEQIGDVNAVCDEKISDLEKTKKFLDGFLEKAKISATVEMSENKDEVFANITGAGDLIGYRGEGLNALQYLASVVVSKNNRHSKKVRIDCESYRAKREQTLISLAKRMEAKVKKTGGSVKLEPMTANERRIIHTALADSEFVETVSKGEEPHRYLIVYAKKKD